MLQPSDARPERRPPRSAEGWRTCSRDSPWGLHAAAADGRCARCGWTPRPPHRRQTEAPLCS